MEVTELLSWLTDGLTPEETATVLKAVQRDSVKTKAAGYKAQSEFDALAAKQAELVESLDGIDPQGNPKGYRKWYEKYGTEAVKQANDIAAFEKKHGAGAFQKLVSGEIAVADPNQTGTLTMDQVKALLDERLKTVAPTSADDLKRSINTTFQEQFAPNIVSTLKGFGRVVQRHALANRKTEVNFDDLDKIIGEKAKLGKNLTIEEAYEEWDKPEREKVQAAERKAETDAAVAAAKATWEEERQREKSKESFPGSVELHPGNLSAHKGAEGEEKFDKNKFIRENAREWAAAGVGGVQ